MRWWMLTKPILVMISWHMLSPIIMLYTLNVYSAVYQLYSVKLEEKNNKIKKFKCKNAYVYRKCQGKAHLNWSLDSSQRPTWYGVGGLSACWKQLWQSKELRCRFRCSYSIWAEKATAPHSSTLAWKIPWTEEPGGLQSMGLLRVGHDWATSLSLFTFLHWRRKWQPTPVFLPGESQGRGSLVGCRLWGRTESDTTEAT